ncbi:uncharacterized protein ARMOST_19473 [Armillaria ostoyae]|uniref:Uncharacterized protein n=1 Tax=Armillaria ostoyae TaxID=47428 RepID=A0A284S4M6_ARMOS|nr:uncharacterized protein ARMOST_19473 [Armillaria ostoyae]
MIKRALGEDGCDALTQASYSVLNMWKHSTLSSIRDKCCCRTLILASASCRPGLLQLLAILTLFCGVLPEYMITSVCSDSRTSMVEAFPPLLED